MIARRVGSTFSSLNVFDSSYVHLYWISSYFFLTLYSQSLRDPIIGSKQNSAFISDVVVSSSFDVSGQSGKWKLETYLPSAD